MCFVLQNLLEVVSFLLMKQMGFTGKQREETCMNSLTFHSEVVIAKEWNKTSKLLTYKPTTALQGGRKCKIEKIRRMG